ncbi:hypothetical protein BC332_22152 [Capsicum chinense]|nr:hypothetical protein BC332_22152 [Capsicum chinense]
MALNFFVLTIAIMALVTSMSYASDSIPLQDFCVAINDPNSHGKPTLLFNLISIMAFAYFMPLYGEWDRRFCKNPEHVTADDFIRSGLNMSANASYLVGVAADVNTLRRLNTLGMSLYCIDYAPYALNAPHTNPRANLSYDATDQPFDAPEEPSDYNSDATD